jgi:hypothetical protein
MNNTKGKLGIILICALGALGGCEKKAGVAPSGLGASAEVAAMAAIAPPMRSRVEAATLAYEHTVAVETTREVLPTRMQEIEDACNADRASGCTILDVSLHSQNDLPNGSIRMRLAPGGVEPLVALASKDGEIRGRTTHAEDLAEPIADAERQLALMSLHRDRLTEFMKSKELKVDQLITVSKELATVQSQIEGLSTQRANLRRRIDTDLLTINLSLPAQEYAADQSPISDALRSFASDFREALGMVIRFVAVLIPWLVIILPGLFLLRLFWRWIGRMIARRFGSNSLAATTA